MRDEPVLVVLCRGGGVVFLKATSYVRAVLLSPPASHSAALLPPAPSQPPHPGVWKAHLQCLCSLWDGPSVSSHALFVKVFFFSFLSLSEKVVAAFLS